MKKIQIFVALLCFAWTAQAQTLADAKNKIVNENYKGAREDLNALIKSEADPLKQGELYYWLGECDYADKKDDDKDAALKLARESYDKGLVVAKSSPHCLVGMGKLLLIAKNNKEALKMFEKALSASAKKPYKTGHPEIYMLIGDAYLNGIENNAEQAVAQYLRATEVEPKGAVYWQRLGDGNLQKGSAGDAMSAFENAIAKDPKDPAIASVYLKKAVIWKNATKFDLSLEDIEKGLSVNTAFAPLWKLKAEVHMEMKQYNKVTEALDKYLGLLGDNIATDPDAWLRFIKFVSYQGVDYDRAINEGNKFASTFGDKYPAVYRWLAMANYQKGYTVYEKDKKAPYPAEWKTLMEASSAASKKLMTLVGNDRLLDYDYDYAAKTASRLGNTETAVSMYEAIVKLDSTKACVVYKDIAKMYYDAKKYKEGLDALDIRIAKGCETDYLDFYYAMSYSNGIKDYTRCIKYADAYIGLRPDGIDGYNFKAIAINQLDTAETFQAREANEKIISLYEAKPDERGKRFAKTAYIYMAFYYAKQSETDPTQSAKACEMAKKVLAIEPTNKQATELAAALSCPQ